MESIITFRGLRNVGNFADFLVFAPVNGKKNSFQIATAPLLSSGTVLERGEKLMPFVSLVGHTSFREASLLKPVLHTTSAVAKQRNKPKTPLVSSNRKN